MYRMHKRVGSAADAGHRREQNLNSKLHAVCDGEGRSIVMMLTEGQMSDHKAAVLLFDALPNAKELLGDTEHRAVPGAQEDAQAITATGSAPP